MRRRQLLILFSYAIYLSFSQAAEKGPVYITPNLPYVDVEHGNKTIRIERAQDYEHRIDDEYSYTSRPCPPFCIQPIQLAPGVETIGELEVLDYLKKRSSGDESILVIDSRDNKWLQKGMIPGAINIPWEQLYYKKSNQEQVVDILEFTFDVVRVGDFWNFENAKTLVFYCNGPWCGQSPTNIRSLLSIGYPAEKLKWYRGGMQSWQSLGLTVIKP